MVTSTEAIGEEVGESGTTVTEEGLVRRHLPSMATELREGDRRMESEDIISFS